jgi:hypothetical protein
MIPCGGCVAILVILVLVPFLAWCAYLIFCRWLVKFTGDPDDLRHAATAARAFPFKPVAWLGEWLSSRSSNEKTPQKRE